MKFIFLRLKLLIERGGSRSVMTAYNSVDGVSCSANNWLLMQKLKEEWKFDGFVISDANAVGGDVVLALYRKRLCRCWKACYQ